MENEEKLNNITAEYIDKMNKNSVLRNKLYNLIRQCSNKIEKRNESIKSVIQYTVIYLLFSGINIGMSAFQIGNLAHIIVPILTVAYAIVISNDVKFIIKNREGEIYSEIVKYNNELSKLDNQYIEYSNELTKQNQKNSDNKLYLGPSEKKTISEDSLFFNEDCITELEEESVYTKK